MIHFVYAMQKLLRSRRFRWFGPDSLIRVGPPVLVAVGFFTA